MNYPYDKGYDEIINKDKNLIENQINQNDDLFEQEIENKINKPDLQ